MSPTKPRKTKTSSTSTSPEVHEAESRVEESSAEFETAMDHLENRIDTTTQKVQSTMDMARSPKQILRTLISKTRTSASPYIDRGRVTSGSILSQAKTSSRQLGTRVQQNPRPFAFGALAAVAGGVLVTYLIRKRQQSRLTDVLIEETVLAPEPPVTATEPSIPSPGLQ